MRDRRILKAALSACSGFTLLELSVVLVIIALVLGGGLATLSGSMQANQYNTTVAQMDALDKALLSYSVAFGRLPCPANTTYAPSNANYGIEAANSGSCVGGTPAANFQSSSGTVEGSVPTRTLKLPDSFMYDGWGRRISYAVDPKMTTTGALPVDAGCGLSSVNSAASTSAITVYDASGGIRSSTAGYALISHGQNGHGAYTSNGVIVNSGSLNSNEQTNCHCTNSAGAMAYGGTYIAKLPVISTSGAANNFDDIVTFKENWQLQTQNVPLGQASACPQGATLYLSDSGNYPGNDYSVRKVSGGIINAYAGNGTSGYSGDNGPALSAEFGQPGTLATDSAGNLYVDDNANGRLRKINKSSGIITTIAGNGTVGNTGDGGLATSAEITIGSIAIDASNNIYLTDYNANTIRKITAATGIITTVAGNGSSGYSGDGGPATSAAFAFSSTGGIAIDSSGNIYIGDYTNSRVRKITAGTGIVTTIAGNGTSGYTGDGGPATSAKLYYPGAVAVDGSGNVYVSDLNNHVIREITSSNSYIKTYAGNGTSGNSGDGGPATSAEFEDVTALAVDSSNNLYILDSYPSVVREVNASTGIINTVAGTGSGGFSGNGGPATSAKLDSPDGFTLR